MDKQAKAAADAQDAKVDQVAFTSLHEPVHESHKGYVRIMCKRGSPGLLLSFLQVSPGLALHPVRMQAVHLKNWSEAVGLAFPATFHMLPTAQGQLRCCPVPWLVWQL